MTTILLTSLQEQLDAAAAAAGAPAGMRMTPQTVRLMKEQLGDKTPEEISGLADAAAAAARARSAAEPSAAEAAAPAEAAPSRLACSALC